MTLHWKRPVERIGSFAPKIRCNVLVDVGGDGDRAVAERLAHHLEGHAGCQEQASGRMAKVVETDRLEPESSGHLAEAGRDALGVQRLSDDVGEDEVVTVLPGRTRGERGGGLAGLLVPKRLHPYGRQHDRPTAPLRLGLGQCPGDVSAALCIQRVPGLGQRATHDQRAAIFRNVVP